MEKDWAISKKLFFCYIALMIDWWKSTGQNLFSLAILKCFLDEVACRCFFLSYSQWFQMYLSMKLRKKIKSLSSEPKLKTVLEKRDCFDFLTVKWSTLNRPTSIVQLWWFMMMMNGKVFEDFSLKKSLYMFICIFCWLNKMIN